ncbi:RDD family protein [Candidatus Poriferisodalis sp.]|uniref:RDD family protein n=1 Tax=Candidatus Poriferisodalis sp. TaxID=3101277 RepID=UPI003B01DEB4
MGGLELRADGVAQLRNGSLVALAPRRRRVAARAIDLCIVTAVAYWAAYFAVWVMWARPPWNLADQLWYHMPGSWQTGHHGIKQYTGPIGGKWGRFMTLQITWYVTAFVYEIVLLQLRGCTLGKWCRDLRVVSSKDGRPLSALSALARNLHLLVFLAAFVTSQVRTDPWEREIWIPFSIAFFGLLYATFVALFLLSLFGRGVHDTVARSLVIDIKLATRSNCCCGQNPEKMPLSSRFPRPARAPTVLLPEQAQPQSVDTATKRSAHD